MQISENELMKRLMISDASFLTASEKILLSKNLDSFNNLALMSISELSSIVKRDLTRGTWNGRDVEKKAQIALRLIKALNISWTFIDDTDYPAMLREMKDPPYVLFYRGDLNCLNEKCVSVVGTRKATYSGRNAALEFARGASNDSTTVVSGLAFGIDICAHRGALQGTGRKTAAVLPGGIDSIVPNAHTKTAQQIIEQGGIVMSEYTPGTPAQNFRFVQRNRIVAALSPATVVIQAPAGSGAMITAGLALDYNRYVFFHQACFDGEAKALKAASEQDLKRLSLKGGWEEKKARNKAINSPERYVEDGAPVISSYDDYCLQRSLDFAEINMKKNNGQMDLFDN